MRYVTVPGEHALVSRVTDAGPAVPAVLIALGPLLPQWSRHVARLLVFRGQELVKLGAGFRCDYSRPAVTKMVLVLSHPEDRIRFGVTTTTCTVKEEGTKSG